MEWRATLSILFHRLTCPTPTPFTVHAIPIRNTKTGLFDICLDIGLFIITENFKYSESLTRRENWFGQKLFSLWKRYNVSVIIQIQIFDEMCNDFGSCVADNTTANSAVRPDGVFINQNHLFVLSLYIAQPQLHITIPRDEFKLCFIPTSFNSLRTRCILTEREKVI